MGRAPCCDKDGLKKGPWLPEEDQKLVDHIQLHGPGNWRTLPKKAGLERCGKSCRLRWTNYLRPDIKRGRFTFEEEEAIIQLHSVLGNKWSAIAAKLPGRTDNEIKNYWNTHIRKRLLRMGVDPVTHTRHLDLFNLNSVLNFPVQNSSQLNLLKLLGLQTLVNPDLLNLAALLNQNQNLNSVLHHFQSNEIGNNPASINHQSNQIAHNNVSGFGNDPQVMMQVQPISEQFTATIPNFDLQNMGHDTSSGQYVCNNSQVIADFLLNTPDLDSINSDQSLGLSTPCTSQETPLNSNTEIPNSSCCSEDNNNEIDSYCQNLMNFDIPVDFFDVC